MQNSLPAWTHRTVCKLAAWTMPRLTSSMFCCAHPELRRSASMRFVWGRLEQALRQRLAPLNAAAAAPPPSAG